MAIRNLRFEGDPILRKTSKEVKEITPKIVELVDDMLETMYESNGVGLAAPQVGILKRIVVIDVGEGPIVLINPEIIKTEGSQTGDEGCLSVPGKAGTVTRPNEVTVRFMGEDGEWYELEGTELLARAICHECDHLDGKLYVDQGIIAGCAGGGFENICAAADIIKGHNIGSDAFTFSVYPASTPIYMELVKNGVVADLMEAGTVVKTAFCGPCFGAGDTPANNAFSIRHTTRNFPNREGSKLQSGQISSVALMDARSIAATAANKGYLTPATAFDVEYKGQKYHFDQNIYANRVFDSKGKADPNVEIQFGPNIKDWPEMSALPENLIVKVVSEIHDPVTTTDELIPSGETSSYRSNPLGLAEFALSRKDPAYVGRAKEVQKAQKAIEAGTCPLDALEELKPVMSKIQAAYPEVGEGNVGVGSTIFAVKPGDGSAREQAASCQKVLGGWANIAVEYATKRYRSNLINWGMLPFLTDADHEALPFKNGDYIFVPNVRKAVEEKKDVINAYVVGDELKEIQLKLGDLTDAERQIILDGCLINYYKATK